MGGVRDSWRDLRGLRLVLLLLAISVKLLTPPGYMPGASASAPLAICTGHGAAVLVDHRPGPGEPGGRAGSNQVCAFADHGAWPTPSPVFVPQSASFAFQPPADTALADLAPGRGLSAPPPPSHAPPRLL